MSTVTGPARIRYGISIVKSSLRLVGHADMLPYDQAHIERGCSQVFGNKRLVFIARPNGT